MRLRIFISLASSEFWSYRPALAHALERLGLSVMTMESVKASDRPVIAGIADAVASCDAVLHLAGMRAGALLDAAALAWLRQQFPILERQFPALRNLLSGQEPSSYVQWEAYLALMYRKMLLVATPTTDAVRDDSGTPAPEEAALQAAHLGRLRNMGRYSEIRFHSPEELVEKAAKSDLYELLATAKEAQQLAAPRPMQPQNLPYRALGTLFKGRGEIMRTVREKLVRNSGEAYALALVGLGGIGKTRLAVEYAWQYRQEYTALLFVSAHTPTDLEANLAALSGPLVLNLSQNQSHEQEVRLQAVLDWLSYHPGWLLIIDNVDSLEAVQATQRWLPQLSGGHVLLTTRVTRWNRDIEKLELSVLPRLDAVELLLERTAGARRATPDDDAEAQALVGELGQLALALEQAGAYINTRHISLATYREQWADNEQKLREWSAPSHYPRSLATTWLVTFRHLSSTAHSLLNRLAWLGTAPIPLSLLGVPVPTAEALDTEEGLSELARYSLAYFLPDGLAFGIHPLVKEATRNEQDDTQQQQSFIEALQWLDAAFVGNPQDVRTWPVLEPLRPHAWELAYVHAAAFGNLEPTGRLLNQVGLLLNAKAQSVEAEPLFRRALAIGEAEFGPDHPSVATRLNNLAGLLQATNRLAEAEPLYRRALAITEAHFGSDHPSVATGLNNLAALLQDTNRLAEAAPLMRRALAINETSLGPDHPSVATGLNNLAALLRATNRLAEAEPLFRRALAIGEASFGPDHPSVAAGLNNLAALLQATNRPAEAEPLMRRALAIDETSFGPGHPSVATRLNNLAALLQATNRWVEAEPLMRRALAIDEASLGPDHPSVATGLNNLAGLLQDTNRWAEAESLYHRALAIGEANFGSDHPSVATGLNNLAGLLQATNRWAEAEPLMRRVVTLLVHFYRQTHHVHPNFQTVVRNYVNLLHQLGQTEDAIRSTLEELGINWRNDENK